MNLTEISRHFAYTEWANHLVLDVADTLSDEQLNHDFKTGQHSIFETLVHMLGAEWVWLERWEGEQKRKLLNFDGPFKSSGVTLPKVREGWQEIESSRAALLAGLTDEKLQAPLDYANLRGDKSSQPLIDQMQHVINHATHHRGQIVGFLRTLDIKPPTTDMIHYFRISA